MIYNVLDIAKYLLSIDEKKKFTSDKLIKKQCNPFREGNAMLNKYLFFAQVLYFTKTKELLFNEDILAFDNGPVIEEVRTKYNILVNTENKYNDIDENKKEFLNKLYKFLNKASLDELIEISHTDKNWVKKHNEYSKVNQVMDIKNNYDYYSFTYEDALYLKEML